LNVQPAHFGAQKPLKQGTTWVNAPLTQSYCAHQLGWALHWYEHSVPLAMPFF
jgi:hypothetical protein